MSEFVPWNQLVTYGVVGADVGETVRVVRARLRKLGGHSQFNAPILIRAADGSIAPTSAAMLRKLAQERGAGILEERLEDLLAELCPEPWALEGQEAAQQEARQRKLPVLVTEATKLAGLMLPSARLAMMVRRDKERYDLFDEPLDRAAVAAHEFLLATPATLVAQVAQALKRLRTPQAAHLVVARADGPFGALPIVELDAEVKRGGARVWGLPLGQLALHLRAAESRALGAVGQEQAEAIADKKGYLVLTEDGQVAGLVVSQVVLRGAQPYGEMVYGDVEVVSTYDLFSVPQDVLDRFLSDEAGPEERARFVNLWFKTDGGQALGPEEALVLKNAYSLNVNIGRRLEQSIIQDEGAAIREPPQETPEGTALYVSLFSDDFQIPQPTQPLTLPPRGDSAPVGFDVIPTRRTFGPADKATLDVHIYYRCNLVQAWRLRVEVVAAGQKGQSDAPQEPYLLATRTQDYTALEEMGPRHLSLMIDKAADGSYQFDFVVAADEQADQVRLGCRVRLRREDLTHLITKARRQLHNIARSPDFQGSLAGTPTARRQAMKALATVGRQLYLQLFRLRDRESAGAAVAQWIQEGNLRRESKIQVVDRVGDFVFPWALIYDQNPWDDEVDPEGFWGVRYEIEMLTGALVQSARETKPVIETDQVSLGVGLYDYLPGAREQRAFFDSLKAVAGEQVRADLFNSTAPLRRALESADQHILYFFCHGFTERMAADIQVGDDLLAEFRALYKGQADKQRANLEEGDLTHYDALFDVSDSWLQLTRGKAPLTMMEDTLLAANARFAHGPLVFLNMCESAQVLPSLSGGFIPFFLDFGARGVVGTECPMTSTFADPFAQEFLRRFLGGQRAGRILLELRRDFLGKGNPLGLAYTLYCDADVHLATGIPVPDPVQI